MKLLPFVLAAWLLAPYGGAAVVDADRDAIVRAALDYAEGYYGGEPARMARAVSPYVSKRGLLTPPGSKTPVVVQMNADTLIDASNGVKLAPAERRITTEVFDITGDAASARVFTAQFNDYLHLIRRDGAWQILNVLWHAPPPAGAGAESKPVEDAVRAYVAAIARSDGPGVLAALDPLAHLRTFAGVATRPRIVREQNAESLAAAVSAGQVKLPGAPADVQVTVQGVDDDIAAARLAIGPSTIYLHLARREGRWRVVNSLSLPPAR